MLSSPETVSVCVLKLEISAEIHQGILALVLYVFFTNMYMKVGSHCVAHVPERFKWTQ